VQFAKHLGYFTQKLIAIIILQELAEGAALYVVCQDLKRETKTVAQLCPEIKMVKLPSF
jgi:hypothetical protein